MASGTGTAAPHGGDISMADLLQAAKLTKNLFESDNLPAERYPLTVTYLRYMNLSRIGVSLADMDAAVAQGVIANYQSLKQYYQHVRTHYLLTLLCACVG